MNPLAHAMEIERRYCARPQPGIEPQSPEWIAGALGVLADGIDELAGLGSLIAAHHVLSAGGTRREPTPIMVEIVAMFLRGRGAVPSTSSATGLLPDSGPPVLAVLRDAAVQLIELIDTHERTSDARILPHMGAAIAEIAQIGMKLRAELALLARRAPVEQPSLRIVRGAAKGEGLS